MHHQAGVRRTTTAEIGLVAIEVLGMACLWAVAPYAWIWAGKQVGATSGSLSGAVAVAFLGFVLTAVAATRALSYVDALFVDLRRRAGHAQKQGALAWVAAVVTTFGLIAFNAWYYLLSNAYVIPFMPMH